MGAALAASLSTSRPVLKTFDLAAPVQDTVIYQKDAYKLNRKGDLGEVALSDSILAAMKGNYGASGDTLLTARDTLHAPDSLRLIDPFRYKYYVALMDSLTHVEVSDSLRQSEKLHWEAKDTLAARQDSSDLVKLDSLYIVVQDELAKAAFEKWYNGLTPEARKKYDQEQLIKKQRHIADSLKEIKEEEDAVRDSIRRATPRVLQAFAIPDTMQYKRIIAWQTDPDFQKVDAYVPDTSFNYYFEDYAFKRQDVGASWLGVAGSPVQSFNYFRRKSDSGLDFYTPTEAWTFSHGTLPNYNTKTPYTELAYWGTILAKTAKESDNIHILTTQNITPELNFQILYDRWGGGGMLLEEETANKTFSTSANYLGKKYMATAGFISNSVTRKENGGIVDNSWIRDTTVDSREIAVNLTGAASHIKRRTVFLDQQVRIPMSFVQDLFSGKKVLADTLAAGDTTAVKDSLAAPDSTAVVRKPDSLDRNVTTFFIGHSSEWSRYARDYSDNLTPNSTAAISLYNDVFNYGMASLDTFKVVNLDNKVFVRLQPWSDDAFISKLNVGIGDKLRTYTEAWQDTTKTDKIHRENSLYAYAGVEGNIHDFFNWNAKGRFTFAGAEIGDFDIEANAAMRFYPFRKARRSPLTVSAGFETSLQEPQWYQKHIYTNHYIWDNDFGKTSTTKVQGRVDAPYLRASAEVGYALLAGNLYYDTLGVIRQNSPAMSVFSASARKDFCIADFLHLDNRVLFQLSSRPEVMPLPKLAVNLKWYIEFVAQRSEEHHSNVLVMQVGLNGWYNTAWNAPAWNPNLGVFQNQTKELYNGGPVVDAFINMQWKQACIFLKLENANMGWPFKKADYFSTHGFIGTQRAFKVGIFWPFYIYPAKDTRASQRSSGSGSASSSSTSDSSLSSPASRQGSSSRSGISTSRNER